jgi:hypothetical protein
VRSLTKAALAAVALAPFALTVPGSAAPTCTGSSQAACGGRVVAEPEASLTFHQFDGPLESVGGRSRPSRRSPRATSRS